MEAAKKGVDGSLVEQGQGKQEERRDEKLAATALLRADETVRKFEGQTSDEGKAVLQVRQERSERSRKADENNHKNGDSMLKGGDVRSEVGNGAGNGAATGGIDESGLVKGVIVILLNKNEATRKLVEASLRLFSANFLDCYAYPIHIFHEHHMEDHDKAALQSLTRSKITFEFVDIPRLPLPAGLTHEEVKPWNKWGLGYRQMCRFYSGLLFKLPSMQGYDWYWRLDTDSWYIEPLEFDPFKRMQATGCDYAYNKVRSDDWFVTVALWKTYVNQTQANGVPEANLTRVKRHVLESGTGRYLDVMFETNFEIGNLNVFRSPEYQKFFEYLDVQPPYGFLKSRWGDAPVRVLGVYQLLSEEKVCDLSKQIPYKHGKNFMGMGGRGGQRRCVRGH